MFSPLEILCSPETPFMDTQVLINIDLENSQKKYGELFVLKN